ncbi:MAG: hypothetical protein KME04_18110 [Pleurocapsa minor GSE-CHR-MK-17-07R]|nr:hypothetical protein [Pleurocapsa minor GSE-CHR-MK 17-07R]
MNTTRPTPDHTGRKAPGLQSGQAIVFMALLMVALIAILGLAVDGGGLFFLYRDIQNATDAAVIAATYARCTSEDPNVVEFAGYQAAGRNGFDNNGTSNTVIVNNPPLAGAGVGDVDYVEVTITAQKPSYFIQVVYPGPLEVTSRAVGRCSEPFDPATVPALFGISDSCQNTIDLTGSDWSVDSAVAMHSNNDIHVAGSDGAVIGGAVAVGGIDTSASSNTSFTPTAVADPDATLENPLATYFSVHEFGPNGRYWNDTDAPIRTIIGPDNPDPDFRNGAWRPNGRTLEGLYYVEGDVVINNATIGARGITIAATGSVDFSSGMNAYYYVAGFLVIADETTNCGTDAIKISGSSIQWYGVFYAPNGGASVSGSDLNIIGAVVAKTVNFSASSTNMVYDPDLLDPIPAHVVVSE